MKIVIDTNVLISGVFFGGFPRKVIEAAVRNRINVFASVEIIEEYNEIVDEMASRKQGKMNSSILSLFIASINIIEPTSELHVCRDPDDDKFIECAVDSHALYIVSGDNDLLTIHRYEDIEIITSRDFCEKYLK